MWILCEVLPSWELWSALELRVCVERLLPALLQSVSHGALKLEWVVTFFILPLPTCTHHTLSQSST